MNVIVSVVLVTYNQDLYIAQAIESVLMQNCSYCYELVIGIDNSSDRTKLICEEYQKKFPHKVKTVIQNQNVGLLRNYKSTLNVCEGKYIAILEGDDFWTDVLKLQKQIDFLENNRSYGVVHSDANYLYEHQSKLVKAFHKTTRRKITSGFVYSHLMNDNFIIAISSCFRNDLYKLHINIDNYIKNGFKTLDYPLWLELSNHTKFHYIPEVLCTYRVLKNSISNSDDIVKQQVFQNSILDIRKYFLAKYPITELNEKIINCWYSYQMVSIALVNKDYKAAREFANSLNLFSIKGFSKYLIVKNRLFCRLYSTFFN